MEHLSFGTDGVRGRVPDELTAGFARQLGRAAAIELDSDTFVIGRDTRESGPEFVAAVAAGLSDEGAHGLDLGVVPTPAVAWASADRGCAGVMISASHNPWYDNGIKLFGASGSKLTDAEQEAIEARLLRLAADQVPVGDVAATHESIQGDVAGYVAAVKQSIEGDLAGMRVVLDAANGSGSHIVAPALAGLGADVVAICNEPDGRNINDGCGSTHPERLASTVLAESADVGVALDGDADRLVAVDGTGRVVDGDHIMAILALDMKQRGLLADDTLVVTVMSNLGLLRAMAEAGVHVDVTGVGDRAVLASLDQNGWSLGGEQSGHLIFRDIASTGDGFLSAVQLLAAVKRSGAALATLASGAMTSFPQVLINVAVSEKLPDIADRISAEIADTEATLGASGRVLVRASGTEPVVRVMVEAETAEGAQSAAQQLADIVQKRFA